MDFKFVLEIFFTVFSLLILIVPCFILAKAKMIGKGAEESLSAVVLYVCQPLMLFMSFQKTEFSPDVLLNMLFVALLSIASHGAMIATMFIFVKGDEKKKKCLRFSSVFANCGYMGIPFLQLLYGENGEILIYAGVVIGVFNILAWTVGAYMFTGDKKQASLKKAVMNPNLIALALGLILFVAFKKPVADLAERGGILDGILEKLVKSLTFFADMVTPLSMSVIGIKLSKTSFKKIFTDKTAYLSSAMKLVVMSLFTMLIVAFLPIDLTVKNVVFFTLSMPSATMAVLFAVKFGGDAESATANVLLSTMLSVVTVPLVYMLYSLVCI